MTAFYFRQSGHDHSGENTFEFTHKSFGEYLTAKRIVREVKLIDKKLADRKNDPDEGWDERQALHRWALLCGASAMDEYLFNFVMDEVRLQMLQDSSEVAKWQKTFCELIGFMMKHGMPMELLSPRPDFQEENRQACNAEDSLLAVLGSFQRLTKTVSVIQFPSKQAFGALLARLRGQRIGGSNPMSFHCLSYLDLSHCIFHIRDFFSSDFRGANLQGSDFSLACLSLSNLHKVNLFKAVLYNANLSNADLSNADLSNTDLEGANLERANLRETNLERANLERANLERANLERANLEGANLERANLEGANLRETNLEGANLEGANLKKTILEVKEVIQEEFPVT